MLVRSMSRVDVLSERLIEFVARLASKMSYDQRKLAVISGSSMYKIVCKVVTRVSDYISENRDGLFWCRLCNKGTFTKRGFYLHLVRVHSFEIKSLIEEELRRELRAL
jgi:hypothetical protein